MNKSLQKIIDEYVEYKRPFQIELIKATGRIYAYLCIYRSEIIIVQYSIVLQRWIVNYKLGGRYIHSSITRKSTGIKRYPEDAKCWNNFIYNFM